jgi:pectin methylesterase-like acyl-CoA thioesterase
MILGERELLMKSFSGLVLALLLVSTVALAFNVQPARTEPTTITVPDDYPTIQEAINAANPEDTIYVRAGAYVENVIVNKTVFIIGEGWKAQSSTVLVRPSELCSQLRLIT